MNARAPSFPAAWRQFLKDVTLAGTVATGIMAIAVSYYGLVTVDAQTAALNEVRAEVEATVAPIRTQQAENSQFLRFVSCTIRDGGTPEVIRRCERDHLSESLSEILETP